MFGFAVRVENLWKTYKTSAEEVNALKGVCLKINPGEFVLLEGPSGSGKSTLLHILGTLERPTKGKVLYNDLNPFELDDEELSKFRNRHIGFVFQFHYLINELTVLENTMLPALIRGEEVDIARERAIDLLKSVGLGHRLSHRPFEISGGEKQRVAVVRALINKPSIVLADEPTGSLDAQSAHSVISLMKEMNEALRVSFFVATHNREFEKYADRVYRLRDGTLVE
jgi:ABC-type lipoprotein export system ATPase subunit